MTTLIVKVLNDGDIHVPCALNPADVNCTMTVGDIKTSIHEQRPDLAKEQMTLIHAGKQLPGDDYLLNTQTPEGDTALGLQKESVLHLVMRVLPPS